MQVEISRPGARDGGRGFAFKGNQDQSMAHGGKRPGAGRKHGSQNAQTKTLERTLAEVAREHTEEAIEVLVAVMKNSPSDAAKVSAANSVLDRGHGKPPQLNTNDEKVLKRALEMTDDELAAIAARGGRGTPAAPEGPSKPH